MGEKFNQTIVNLPNNLTHLIFGNSFNQALTNLPHGLTHLSFGFHFNQKIKTLPNIVFLKLNCNNQYIIDYLPNSVEELRLNSEFNLELNNLPTSLRKITFTRYCNYNKELNCLPNFVEFLQLPEKYDKKILRLPEKLNQIVCSKDYKYVSDFANLNVQYYC